MGERFDPSRAAAYQAEAVKARLDVSAAQLAEHGAQTVEHMMVPGVEYKPLG